MKRMTANTICLFWALGCVGVHGAEEAAQQTDVMARFKKLAKRRQIASTANRRG